MSFSTFELTELPEEADDDFALEFTTAEAKLGISMSKEEADGIGHALLNAVDGDMESWDRKAAEEI